MDDKNAISVSEVYQNFGKVQALNNVSLTAKKGKVTALLGPNGAGKSTLIKIMATLLKPTSGTVFVSGIDVVRSPQNARERLGLAGQYAAVDEFLTGRETLEMVGRFYHFSREESQERANELLKQLGLEEAADRQTKTYSGGMRRRLDLGASLVATPKVLFLDEPTTGLDPRTRLQLWDIIRDLVGKGVSILLTTQYLEEADTLADYLYVIDRGQIIAEGTSEQLKKKVGQDIIEIKVGDAQLEKAKKILEKSLKKEVRLDSLTRRITIQTSDGSEDLLQTAQILKDNKIKAEELGLHRPSLDDVFLKITGKPAEESE